MGFDPRLEEPHRTEWKVVWTWLRTWLRKNVTATSVTAAATIAQAVILGIGLYSLYFARKTLEEGNRLAWQTFLDNKSAEMGRLLFNNDVLHCVYNYDIFHIDVHCPEMVYHRKNLPHVVEYVDQWIRHLKEIKKYSDTWGKEYYQEWYAGQARYFSDDPTGVVSFVLWKYWCPDGRDNPSVEVDPKTLMSCPFAISLGICTTNENFHQDPERCFENLEEKRDKFLRGVGEAGVRELGLPP
jgi:hypothetical protein